MQMLLVPTSPGELIDKITILEIKSERIRDIGKRANVVTELNELLITWRKSAYAKTDIASEWQQLRAVNQNLWNIEDDIREQERQQCFGAEFIRLARVVYVTNDERARIKRVINTKLGSMLIEEKSYAEYRATMV